MCKYVTSHINMYVRTGNEGTGAEVTAGKKFKIWLQLIDQWGAPFGSGKKSGKKSEIGNKSGNKNEEGNENSDVTVRISLNENNPQGAVIWGLKSNRSSDGLLHYSSLAVSQPGEALLFFLKKLEIKMF